MTEQPQEAGGGQVVPAGEKQHPYADIVGLDKLAKALAKAQGEMKNATLNKVNPHFKSKYADLAAIRDAVIPAFSKNGLAVVQIFEPHGGSVYINTMILHESGQCLSSLCPILAGADGPQPFGSATTYARRYGLAAIAGIAAEEDDDANAAQAKGKGIIGSEDFHPKGAKFETSKDLWGGPLTKTNFKKAMNDFVADIVAADDLDSLDILVNQNKKLVEQCKADLPSWYYGVEGSDVTGLEERIRARRIELGKLATEEYERAKYESARATDEEPSPLEAG